MKSHSLRALTAKFYTYAFFDDFILIYPFYTLLFADTGIGPAQIATLLMVWSGTGFLLEIPSGAIADKFNRRNVLVAAIALRAVAFGVWILFPTYWGFFAGFVLWGMNSALTSGTEEALLYDELAKLKKLPLYTKITGRIESLRLGAMIAADLVASSLAGFGYNFILALSIATIFVAMTAVLLLPRSKRVESTGETKYLTYFTEGVRDAIKNPAILLVVVFIGMMALGAVDEYFGLLLREKAFDNSMVALWGAVIGAFGIAGSLIAHRLEDKKLPLELILLLWAGLLFAAAWLGGIAVPLLLGVFMMVYYIIRVVFTARLQRVVSDKTRATTTSVGGFIEELFAVIAFGIVGLTSENGSYQRSFYFLSLLVVIVTGLFWLFARFITRRHDIQKLGL